ncbi:hypothetical protein FOL47_004644, partial [Perkinsus chesapeaki]
KDWMVLNIKSKNGCLTNRSAKWVEDWIKEDKLCALHGDMTPHKVLHACTSPRAAVSASGECFDGVCWSSKTLSESDFALYVEELLPSEVTVSNCAISVGNAELISVHPYSDPFPRTLMTSPIKSSYGEKATAGESVDKNKPLPIVVRKLFGQLSRTSNSKGWTSIYDHYSVFYESSPKGKDSLRRVFESGELSAESEYSCNNANYLQSGEVSLPASVVQMRRKGYDGSDSSRGLGANGKYVNLYSMAIDPAIAAT